MFSMKLSISCILVVIILCVIQTHANNNTTIIMNTTISPNATSRPNGPKPEEHVHLDRFTILFCIVVMVTGFCGNFLVILIFTVRCTRLKTCEIFMVSLAVADLIGTFTLPLSILRSTLKVPDTVSGVFIACQFPAWLTTTCISVSAVTLVAIAVDRFVIVTWPLKIRSDNRMIIYIIVAYTWVIGGSFGFVYFFWMVQIYDHHTGTFHCAVDITVTVAQDKALTISLFLLQMVLPVSIMTFLYSIIAYKLSSGSASARRLSETDNVTRIRNRRQRKATKLFVTVVLVFYILVLPSNVFHMILSFGHLPFSKPLFYVYRIVTLLQLSNSCVNPIIYSRLHKSFRKSTLSLFFGCCFPNYWRYDWNSKFISRSSYLRRRRSTAQTQSQYMASVRATPSPCPDGNAENWGSRRTSPRLSSGVSPRSSRHTSTGSDDVFCQKPSLRVGFSKDEENVKIHLGQIPEQNAACNDDQSKAPQIGKYMPFSNANLGEKLMNGTSRQISVDSSNTMTSDLDRLSSIESQNACVNEHFTNEDNRPCKYQILNQHSSNLDPNGIRL